MNTNSLLYALGSIEETIKENYTSEKLFLAVDLPLYKGIELILEHTELFEEFLIGYYTFHTRKYVYDKNQNTDVLLYKFMNCNNVNRIDILKQFKFNRDVLTLPLDYVVSYIQPYINALFTDDDQAYQISRLLRFKTNGDITPYLLQIQGEHSRYKEIREAIIQKFYRLIVQHVNKNTGQKFIDPEDMAVEYYRALLKAFSRFDVSSGTFASYATNWFKNARSLSQNTDEMGVAFNIPSNVRIQIAKGENNITNYSVSEDSDQVQSMITSHVFDNDDDVEAIIQIMAAFDTNGLYRMTHDIEVNPQNLVSARLKSIPESNSSTSTYQFDVV